MQCWLPATPGVPVYCSHSRFTSSPVTRLLQSWVENLHNGSARVILIGWRILGCKQSRSY